MFPAHSFHAFTQYFHEFSVDHFYLSRFPYFAFFASKTLSLMVSSTLLTVGLYSCSAMAFFLAKLLWKKSYLPAVFFHDGLMLSSFHFSSVFEFHMCRPIFTTSELILNTFLPTFFFFLHCTEFCCFLPKWHNKMYPSNVLSMPFTLLLLSFPCSFHENRDFLACMFDYLFSLH